MLDINQTKLATDEDRLWELDYWARLFKATTWEEIKMLTQQDIIFQETDQTIFQQNQYAQTHTWYEAVKEAERVARTTEYLHKKELEERDAALTEMNAELSEKILF